MEPSHLFVYGTLRRGSDNKFARLLHAQAQLIGTARVPGRLYRLGAYPGAVSSATDGEWVRGEVYSIEDPRWILPALDNYEGPDFQRVTVDVLAQKAEEPAGSRVQALQVEAGGGSLRS